MKVKNEPMRVAESFKCYKYTKSIQFSMEDTWITVWKDLQMRNVHRIEGDIYKGGLNGYFTIIYNIIHTIH